MVMLAITRTDPTTEANLAATTATVASSSTSSSTVSTTTTTVQPVVAAASTLTDVSDIVSVAVASIVRVDTTIEFRGRQRAAASGSGVIVDANGLIVTNAHVVETGTGVTVTLDDGSTHTATVVGVDTGNDLAAISIDVSGLTPVTFGSTSNLLVGDPVVAVGYPLGLAGGPSVSAGIVSAKNRTITDSTASLSGILQTDAAITEGSSGGALLDAQGRLVGITTAVGVSSVGIEGIGFAIPVETVERVVPELTADS